MSFEISTAFVQHYSTNIQLLLQQKGSLLRDKVTTQNYQGKAAKAVEQIGSTNAQVVAERHSDTPLISTKHDARWVFPNDYIWADLIDDEDKLKMIIDPTSSYAINGAYAIGRAMDDEIIKQFFAQSKTGENGTTGKNFMESQKVAAHFEADTPSGMSVAKLREAKRILRANEVDMDHDPLYCAITAQQEHELLHDTHIISKDFNYTPVLADGKLSQFMGIQFVHIQRLTEDKDGMRACPMWSKSGMHLGIWNEINVAIDRRSDKRNATQIMVKGSFGATRLDEKKVVQIACLEDTDKNKVTSK